ncbi:MAG: hypothetical protein JRH01_09345 [Deltaproteobacteria bacterium]|nr:hypothetical protein [Deltaproteobacteria bacterium]MBW2393367.1 hypothetical protein [Deltaproteobacteria bacterium]
MRLVRFLQYALLLATLCAGFGCQTLVDLERARGLLFRPPPAPEIPVLTEEPPAELPAVAGLVAVGEELRAIPLRWEPVLAGNVGGYTIERALSEKGSFDRVGSVAGRYQTAWIDRGLDLFAKQEGGANLGDGKVYFYRVRAFEPGGQLGPPGDAPAEASTAPAPDPPEGFQAFSRLPRAVALRWDPSGNPLAAGYVVLRSPAARGQFRPLAELSGRFTTTYFDEGLGDLRVFYYQVAVINAAGGQGEPTKTKRAVTKPVPLPPVGLEVTAQQIGANELAWARNVEPDLHAYRLVRRREGSEPEIVGEIEVGTTTARDEQVGAGERVAYLLVALDRDGLESGPSAEIEVEAVAYGLAAETRNGAITLSWSPEVQASLAETRVFSVGTFGEREIGRSAAPEFKVPDTRPGASYRFRIVGVREDGSEAPESKEVQAQLPEENL